MISLVILIGAFSSGILVGHSIHLFIEMNGESRCQELYTAVDDYHNEIKVRCELTDGHIGPCKIRYKRSYADAFKATEWRIKE